MSFNGNTFNKNSCATEIKNFIKSYRSIFPVFPHSIESFERERERREGGGSRFKEKCVSFDLIINEIILSSTTNGENRNKKALYFQARYVEYKTQKKNWYFQMCMHKAR